MIDHLLFSVIVVNVCENGEQYILHWRSLFFPSFYLACIVKNSKPVSYTHLTLPTKLEV